MPILFSAALVLGISQTFSTPSMLAMVPYLVPAENVAAAVSLNIVTLNVARAIGPVLGAIVVDQLGPGAAFGINAVSFMGLVVALMFVRPRPANRPPGAGRPRLTDTIRGLRHQPEVATLLF
ncbi:MAG TPA: MFS transporter, partial [Ilumatobacteraceae bacterium]|nr:MFS transporter [Ilumatobacteraceae bacterium]